MASSGSLSYHMISSISIHIFLAGTAQKPVFLVSCGSWLVNLKRLSYNESQNDGGGIGLDVQRMEEIGQEARKAFLYLSSTPVAVRNQALLAMGESIRMHQESILEANRRDVKKALEAGIPKPLISRLTLTAEKCESMISGLNALSLLPDPLGQIQYAKELSDGLRLYRVACPIGVIGVIFESRPDAFVQISSLCLKSGNAVLLKGGREAAETNEALYQAIRDMSRLTHFPPNWCQLLHTREDVTEMLKLDSFIDLIIPRGSNSFVRSIMENSNIPVLGHADGICHVYVDEPCDLDVAVKVAVDSKAQNLSVCNAMETLLVHRKTAGAFLPAAATALREKGIILYGDEQVRKIISCEPATEEDWKTEYLDAALSIKMVADVDEAIRHINHYGSGHTDCIVSSDDCHVRHFMALVDSAGVFHNCSTRFSDGYLYGFGAEIGIATGKLHARGPMGLEGLCTYKYKLFGKGHTLGDLREGKFAIIHRDIEPRLG